MNITFKTVEYQALSAGDTFLWAFESKETESSIQSTVYMAVDPCGKAIRESIGQHKICINLKSGQLCSIEYTAKVIPIYVNTTADITTLEIEAAQMNSYCPNCRRHQDAGSKCYYCGAAVNPVITTHPVAVGVRTEPVYTLDKVEPYVIIQSGEFQPMELEGTFHGKNGFRVMWDEDGSRTARVEVMNEKGEWERLSGIQKINITLSVNDRLPRVSIERIIVPEKKI